MKKILIFLGIIIVLFGSLAFLTNTQNSEKVSEDNPYGKDFPSSRNNCSIR